MMKRNILIIITLGITLSACQVFNIGKSNAKKELAKISWLLGKWENVDETIAYYENWEKISDKHYKGMSYWVLGSDTTFSETIHIKKDHGSIYYIDSVKALEDIEVTRLKMISNTGEKVVFFDQGNEDQKKVIYFYESPDKIRLKVSGRGELLGNSETFILTRRKE